MSCMNMYLNITELREINNPFLNSVIRRSSALNSAEKDGEDCLIMLDKMGVRLASPLENYLLVPIPTSLQLRS
jgi:hypothetical protein